MQVNAEVMRLDLPAYIEWIEMKPDQKRAHCLDRLFGLHNQSDEIQRPML